MYASDHSPSVQPEEQPSTWKDRFRSIAIGAGIATAGAVLTYLTEYVSSADFEGDFGTWAPAIAAGWAVVVNAARKAMGY